MKTTEKLETAYSIVAKANLAKRNLSLSNSSVEFESARIERMVDHYYKVQHHDMGYFEFVSDFLCENLKRIMETDELNGSFLDDVPEVVLH